MSKVNKVVRISLSGGLIGWLTTNPRKAIDDSIDSKTKMVGMQYTLQNIELQI